MLRMRLVLLALIPAATSPASAQEPKKDLYGDLLPAGAIARIGTVRLRHATDPSDVALSPDGKLLVTADDDRPLRLWNGETGVLIKEIPLPSAQQPRGQRRPARGDVAAIAFAKDLRRFHVLLQDGTLRAYNVRDGAWSEVLARNSGSEGAYYVGAVSPDRTHFLHTPVHGKDSLIDVFAVGQDLPVARISDKFAAWHRPGSLTADNSFLAAVVSDGTAKVWEIRTGKEIGVFTPPLGRFFNAAISPDGKSVTGIAGPKEPGGFPVPKETTLVCFDRATGRERYRIPGWEGVEIEYSPDGSRLISFTMNEVLVADAATGKLVHRMRGHGAWRIFGHSFGADGSRLATVSRDHTAIVWDLNTGKPALDFDSPRGPVELVAFSPDGKTLLTGCAGDHTVGLWDVETGKRRVRLDADMKGGPLSCAFTADGSHVVVGYGTKGSMTGSGWTARLWRVSDGKLVREFVGHTDGVHYLAISPDDKRLATQDRLDKARVWNLDTGELEKDVDWPPENKERCAVGIGGSIGEDSRFLMRLSRPIDLRFTKAGELLAAKQDNSRGVEVVNLTSGKPVGRYKAVGFVPSLTLSSDGQLVASRRDTDAPGYSVQEIATGHELYSFPIRPEWHLSFCGFSPDGRTLAFTEYRGPVHVADAVHLMNLPSGRETQVIRGHNGSIASLAFSPDGKRLATGGWDSTVLIWDLTSSK